jgi:hypothetical protein
MSTRKQPGYAILFGLTIALVATAILTLLPLSDASHNVLGYSSLCSWVPFSTLILLAAAGTSCKLRSKLFKGQNPIPADPK